MIGSSPTTPSLVAAAPIEALLTTLTRDVELLKGRLPGSSDVATLQLVRDDLARALEEGRRADVWLSPKQVAQQTGKGLSTVTLECRNLEEHIGAVRNGKRGWRIHWPTYEAAMLNRKPRSAA